MYCTGGRHGLVIARKAQAKQFSLTMAQKLAPASHVQHQGPGTSLAKWNVEGFMLSVTYVLFLLKQFITCTVK